MRGRAAPLRPAVIPHMLDAGDLYGIQHANHA